MENNVENNTISVNNVDINDTIKVSYIKSQLEKGIKIEDLGIKIIPYKSIGNKFHLCRRVVYGDFTNDENGNIVLKSDGCLKINDNGFTTVDFGLKCLNLKFVWIFSYTNIEFDLEDNNDFDFLCESGVMKYIEYVLIDNGEYNFIVDTVEEMINQEKEINNSLSAVVDRVLTETVDKLLSKLPSEEVLKNFPNMINQIDSEKLGIIKDVIGFNNGVKVSGNRQQKRKEIKK